jgi:hypothetical protein
MMVGSPCNAAPIIVVQPNQKLNSYLKKSKAYFLPFKQSDPGKLPHCQIE